MILLDKKTKVEKVIKNLKCQQIGAEGELVSLQENFFNEKLQEEIKKDSENMLNKSLSLNYATDREQKYLNSIKQPFKSTK